MFCTEAVFSCFQSSSTNQRFSRNVARRSRISAPSRQETGFANSNRRQFSRRARTSPTRRQQNGFSDAIRRRQTTFSQIRNRPPSNPRTSSIIRNRNRNFRLRPNWNRSRFSNVRFGRLINSGSRNIPQRHSSISHQQRISIQPSNQANNRMVSVPKSLLTELLQNARRLNRKLNSNQVETMSGTVTQPPIRLTISPNNIANSLTSNIGNQLQNLLQWNQIQNVLDSSIQQRIPSLPSSLSFQPNIGESFGNDQALLILPTMTPQIIIAPQPKPTVPEYKPSQFDIALQAHILDELGFENLVTDTPDAAEVHQQQPQKKPKKTKIVINTNTKSKHTAQNNSKVSINQQGNNNPSLQQIAAVTSTTLKPIRIVFSGQQTSLMTDAVTTPAPAGQISVNNNQISVNNNQKLIITPSGNYTIQHLPNSNNGFQIA
ncbi:uncharacterized protein LOC133179713 [Saccostrea echinata]|uniref:uncharacterized protein LOC133179713 n=1 Tax=Saccostrea echinata TaxID=191078 RepID=UPI002A800BE9|nr:uncharacterized protein LOC133179713 [Saccostrea echinata]